MKLNAIAFILCVGISASPLTAQERITEKIKPSTKLTETSYPDILKAILVRPSEEQWEEIPWRPNLATAIDEAREKDKPILLWMMNGHPCGMT